MHPILASAGGSELPWFTPIAVSLLLVAVAAVYRLAHRHPDNGAGADPSAFVHPEDDREPPPPREGGDRSTRFLIPRLH